MDARGLPPNWTPGALRVAETFPPERAADAHRMMAAGGIRGRLLIVF